jgi:CheY-like chemotaxis protein
VSVARILIVEDDSENRLLMRTIVAQLGHEVFSVADGVAALEALGVDPGELAGHADFDDADRPIELNPPPAGLDWDLVFMDVLLPGPDGREVCRFLRDAGCEVPVVAVTGLAMSGDRESCLESGMNDYVAKPFTVDVVAERVEAWI